MRWVLLVAAFMPASIADLVRDETAWPSWAETSNVDAAGRLHTSFGVQTSSEAGAALWCKCVRDRPGAEHFCVCKKEKH